MDFPRLYKKTSNGSIQFWQIKVDDNMASSTITTTYGQLGTDSPQETRDVISSGKNIGKKNETRHFDQAVHEATSKWEKQQKKGYVNSIDMAESEGLSSLIEGGIVPMLAHSHEDHGHKIKFPAYLQPKLDGIRCIAILKDGKCTLWSRTRKPITGVPHIARAIERGIPPGQDIVLDGELYNHNFKSNFEAIVSFVRQENPAEGHEIVQYHVYDTVNADPFWLRAEKLKYMKHDWFNGIVQKVVTCIVNDEYEEIALCKTFVEDGYEGAIIRNANGLYVNKRSYDLQKIKEFKDAEFEIVGIEEGRGKLAGHVGAFVCKTETGEEFKAKMSGDTAKLKEYFENHGLWQGKKLTVQYQGLTGKNSVPRFPVGLRVRDFD